ncbi:MAG: TetR family transcriptional regulator, partial [Azospirillaceae bacterium]
MDAALENRTTRDAILEAAEALFSEHGFKAVTIREIARRAGANVASISYYFQSKEGLLRAIYEEH